MNVDGARQQQQTAGVDDLTGVDAIGVVQQNRYPPGFNAHIEAGDAGFQDDLSIFDEGVQGHSPVLMRWRSSLLVVQRLPQKVEQDVRCRLKFRQHDMLISAMGDFITAGAENDHIPSRQAS